MTFAVALLLFSSCRTGRQVVVVEARDSVRVEERVREIKVTDTLFVEVPAQSAERTTADSTSHLENDYAVSDARINPDGIFHIPLATNVRDNYATATMASAADRARFSSDISFIGSLYSEKCLYNQITLPEKMRGYVDGLIEAQLLVYGYNFIEECVTPELIEAFCKVRPELINFPDSMKVNTKAVIAQHIISVKVAEQERLRYLKALSEHFNVDLYTGSDTYSMPLIHNRGFAKTNTEMPIIFHQSKINLNLTAKSIRSGLSLRIFDVLGCEGFLITNYQAELPEHFNIGEDLEAYTSLDDLMGKCEYYLSHDKERREIAHNGFEKVKKYHTYDIRLTQMLEIAFGLK